MRPMFWFTLALVLALLSGSALAQQPPAAASQLDDLLKKSPGKVFAVTDDGGKNPDALVIGVFGDLGSGSPTDAENTAKTFVKKYGQVLGFPDSPLLGARMKVFRDWSGDDFGRFITYAPSDADKSFFLPGMVTFVFKPDGSLVAVLGDCIDFNVPPDPAISVDDAISKARDAIKKEYPEEKDVVTGDAEVEQFLSRNPFANDTNQMSPILRVYSVTISSGRPPVPKRVLLEASTGVKMFVEDARLTHNSAHLYVKDGSEADTKTLDLDDLIYPGFFPDWTIDGEHLKVDPRITPYIDRAEAWTGWFKDDPKDPNPNPPFAEEMVYYHCTQARNKARGWGAKDIDRHDPLFFNHWQSAKCGQFDPNSDLEKACECLKTSNAWYDPSDGTLNFSSNNARIGNRHPAYDATAICHEYGHFVHKMLSPHWNLGFANEFEMFQSKAIAEAFADLFSCSILDQPKVGVWLISDIQPCDPKQPRGNISRDMEKLLTLSDLSKNNDPHEFGRCFSSGLWKLRSDGTLGKDEMIKTLIAGMRLCNLPCRLRNAALAFMAADQAMASPPHTQKVFDMFKSQGLFVTMKSAAAH